MPTYIGENKIVDRYLGDKFLEAAYIGDQKVYDPYTEITGYLPVIFKSRAAVALKNYRIHGTTEGAGVDVSVQLDEPLCGLDNSIDSLDLLSGLLTRHIKKIVLDGTEDWSIINQGQNSNYFRLSYANYDYGYNDKVVCSHYTNVAISTSTTNVGINVLSSSSANAFVISIRPTNAASMTRTDFKTWLADQYANGTPVTVWFILKSAETETIIVPSGLSGTLEGYLTQSTAPTENNPIYPVANGTKLPNNKYEVFQSYKLPLTVESGETENLAPFIDEWGNGYVSNNGSISIAGEDTQERYSPQIAIEPNVTYQWAYQTGTFPESSTKTPWSGIGWYNDDGFISRNAGTVRGTLEVVAPANAKYAILSFRSFGENYNTMFIKSSTPPDHYIPHRYESNYDLFIGFTKLGEEEYADYGEQKIYKMSEGTLVPTDPPVPFPPIPTYKGENTLSSTETLGEVTVKGRIRELTYRRVEYLKSTGTQYIQTDIIPNYRMKVESNIALGGTYQAGGYGGIFGTIADNRRFVFLLTMNVDSPRIYGYYGYPWSSPDSEFSFDSSWSSLSQKTLWKLSHSEIRVGSTVKTNLPAISQDPVENSLTIFAIINTDSMLRVYSLSNHMTVYDFKIYDGNDNIVHNLIPVEREDGELGLYDTITNKFYTNAGTGTFEKGEYI